MKRNGSLAFSIGAIVLLTGCIHNKGLQVSKVTGRDARVVPVRSQPIVVISEKTFEMAVAIRFVDSAQGEIVGSRYAMVRKKISPVTGDSSFDLFVEDFRRCATEASRECLKQLKLL